jgi:hypothetical protein
MWKELQPGLDFVVFRGQVYETGIVHYLDTFDQTILLEAASLEIRAEDVDRETVERGLDLGLRARTLQSGINTVLDEEDGGALGGEFDARLQGIPLEGRLVDRVQNAHYRRLL